MWKIIRLSLYLLQALLVFYSPHFILISQASDETVQIVRNPSNNTQYLVCNTKSPLHKQVQSEKKLPPKSYASLLCQLNSQNVHAIFLDDLEQKDLPYQFDAKRRIYRTEIPIRFAHQKVIMIAILPSGVVEREEVSILTPAFKLPIPEDPGGKSKGFLFKNLAFSANLGLSWVSFSRTSLPSISQAMVTPKISLDYLVSNSVRIGGSAFINAFSLFADVPTYQIQFLGGNLRVGYTLPWINRPWRLSLMGGAYWASSLSNPAGLGYTNISGPQLYPVLFRELPKNRSAWLYLKYSPIMSGGTVLTGANSELGIGGGYSFSVSPKFQPFSVTLDLSNLQLNLNNVSLQTQSVSLGFGYRF